MQAATLQPISLRARGESASRMNQTVRSTAQAGKPKLLDEVRRLIRTRNYSHYRVPLGLRLRRRPALYRDVLKLSVPGLQNVDRVQRRSATFPPKTLQRVIWVWRLAPLLHLPSSPASNFQFRTLAPTFPANSKRDEGEGAIRQLTPEPLTLSFLLCHSPPSGCLRQSTTLRSVVFRPRRSPSLGPWECGQDVLPPRPVLRPTALRSSSSTATTPSMPKERFEFLRVTSHFLVVVPILAR